MIIDTHAHYDDEAFDTDREALLTSMYDGGIEKIVNAVSYTHLSEHSPWKFALKSAMMSSLDP